MIGYKPAGRFAPTSRAAGSRSPSLSSERQAELDAAISDAFLRGTDEDFERLLEVCLPLSPCVQYECLLQLPGSVLTCCPGLGISPHFN